MRSTLIRHLTPLATALLLAGCAVTRVEPPQAVQAPAQFKEGGQWQRAAATQAAPDAWWTLFQDPQLDELQKRLLIGNENLKASAAQVASARASLEASRTVIFPTLSAGLSGTRSDSAGSNTSPSNSASLSLNASWEVDLWGRLSQATSGAQSGYQASTNDLAAARLSAQSLLTQSYFSLRTAEAQQALLERSVAAYQRSLELTQTRYAGGVASRSDVLQAETQLRNAQSQALESATQRAQLEHAIAVLLGQPPAALNLARSAQLPTVPAVPELLPSTLLQRRPDIAAAQSRVAAAYAQIGVADAAFFPSLTLSAGAGYRSSTLSNLVSAPNLFWSLGPSLAASLFDGGQRKLAATQARNTAEIQSANYRQLVLTALQEVEDNLVLADHLQQQTALQQQALLAAQRNLEIVTEQYRAGTVSFLNVVTAQTAALNSEQTLLSSRNRQLAAVNLLLKNIAGRWEPARL
ncbi:efflux transporter outer membrane subunit [Pelomonas sp. SE-A7]|uniref:efflux transporter outer membrane subunit n=1 Tax=Pelomonas sp. SE-A7 TaxID=3054953 RepID=UPI00259D29F7|nr:efflux transporter outer membrane subunit [Pelomonas sp. SE-A7]MDM4767979.1 efflux transporter outer membrane subunit [Pelomonas sp. SE-A7]